MENKITTLFEKGQSNTVSFLLFQIRNFWDDILHALQTAVGTKTLLFLQMLSIYIIIISLSVDIGLFVSLQVISYFSKNVWSHKPVNIRATAAEHATLEDRFYILLPCWVAREAEHFLSICSQCCLDTDSTDQAEAPSLPPASRDTKGFAEDDFCVCI